MHEGNSNKLAVQRLTALWALNESGLGGLLHAFNSPFTGLIVGSVAIVLICLICQFSEDKWKTVMTSLTIVLIVKAGVSPHSNVSAYFAVCFQATMGAFLFSVVKQSSIAATILSISALIESALQKIISLTIVYGKTLWQAFDDFGLWVSQKIGFLLPMAPSKALIIFYIGLHAVTGLVVGIFCARLIKSVRLNMENKDFIIDLEGVVEAKIPDRKNRVLRHWKIYLVLTLTMIILAAYGYYTEGWESGLYFLIRTIVILGILYGIAGPIILRLINRILKKRKAALASEVEQVFDLFPYMKILIIRAWQDSQDESYFKRGYAFVLYSLLYILHFKKES